MVELTRDNYHTTENKSISSTKVKDFLKSKELYYKRHIEGSIKSDDTTSITLGRIVDKVLEQGTLHFFHRTYQLKVLKKVDKDLFNKQKKIERRILPPAMYHAAIAICEKVLRSPFYKWYGDRKLKSMKQLILQQPYRFESKSVKNDIRDTQDKKIGITTIAKIENVSICGMLDRLTFDKDTAYIDDYKTSAMSQMKSSNSWVYLCYSYGYFIQMAVYRWLVQQQFPEMEHYVCRHIVLGTSAADLYPIKLFVIPDEYIDEAEKIFFETVEAITLEQEWIDPLPTWDNVETLPTEAEMKGEAVIEGSLDPGKDLEDL